MAACSLTLRVLSWVLSWSVALAASAVGTKRTAPPSLLGLIQPNLVALPNPTLPPGPSCAKAGSACVFQQNATKKRKLKVSSGGEKLFALVTDSQFVFGDALFGDQRQHTNLPAALIRHQCA